MLPENEYYSFENRNYINPQVSLDEQNRFIDNLRNVQAQKNQQITTQTYNLGSALPSNLGGLIGGGGYWRSRYQTPQTNTLVNDLRTAAQSKALSDILANEQAKMQKRYNAAYRASQIRGSNGSGGDNNKDPDNIDTTDTGVYKIGSIEVDQIIKHQYDTAFTKYWQEAYNAYRESGLSTQEASAKAREEAAEKAGREVLGENWKGEGGE